MWKWPGLGPRASREGRSGPSLADPLIPTGDQGLGIPALSAGRANPTYGPESERFWVGSDFPSEKGSETL